MYKCKKCNKEKELSEFYLDNRLTKGHCSSCKECVRKQKKKIRTPERAKKYNQTAYLKDRTNPERWEKRLAQGRKFYKKNGRKRY